MYNIHDRGIYAKVASRPNVADNFRLRLDEFGLPNIDCK